MVNPISYESKEKERKDLIIKHTTTTTHSKPVIFVVISLLAVALIYSASASYVFAAKPAIVLSITVRSALVLITQQMERLPVAGKSQESYLQRIDARLVTSILTQGSSRIVLNPLANTNRTLALSHHLLQVLLHLHQHKHVLIIQH
jgi:hypothetical protein